MRALRILLIVWSWVILLAYSLPWLLQTHVDPATAGMGVAALLQLIAALGTLRDIRAAWWASAVITGVWLAVSVACFIFLPTILLEADARQGSARIVGTMLGGVAVLLLAPAVLSVWLFIRHRWELVGILLPDMKRAT